MSVVHRHLISFTFTIENLDDLPATEEFEFPSMNPIAISPVDILKISYTLKLSSSIGNNRINTQILKKYQSNLQSYSISVMSLNLLQMVLFQIIGGRKASLMQFLQKLTEPLRSITAPSHSLVSLTK